MANELLRVKHGDLPLLKKAARRDVMLHAACTIMSTSGGVEVIGEKEKEICQFAVHIPSHLVPKPESHIRRAFAEMCEMTLAKMRAAGLVR
jgi:hypothetical protein